MTTPAPRPRIDLTGEPQLSTRAELEATRDEVAAWFFDDYLVRWAAATSGRSGEGPEFVLDYWGTPMHVSLTGTACWCLTDDDVLAFLEANQGSLRGTGYDHTTVPDRRVRVYSSVGAAVEVIWSRRTAEETELQRLAVHFEVARGEQGWRVVAVQAAHTTADTLAGTFLDDPSAPDG